MARDNKKSSSMSRAALQKAIKEYKKEFRFQKADEMKDDLETLDKADKKAKMMSSMAPPSLAARSNQQQKRETADVSGPFTSMIMDMPYAYASLSSIAERDNKKGKA